MNPQLISSYMLLAAVIIMAIITWLSTKNAFLKKHGQKISCLIMLCPCMYSFSSGYGITKAVILGFLLLAAYAIIYWPKKNDFMKKHKVLIIVLALLCPILYASYLIWFVEPL